MTSNNSQGLAFRPYKRLPAELQVQIIKEALDDLTKPLAAYSAVDRVWQDIIEERSFAALYVRHHDIAEFGRICVGRRTRLVSKIRLYIREESAEHFGPASQPWNDSITVAELDASSVKVAAGRAIEQAFRKMFEIMTGWTTDRSRAVVMTYDLSIPWLYSLPHEGGLIKADFTGLAPVPVIGSIYNAYDRTDIHPVSMVQLLGFLPNVQYSMLTLGSRINGSAFHRGIAEASVSSLDLKPLRLTSLKARDCWMSAEMEIGDTLINLRPLSISMLNLTAHLTQLELDRVVDVTYFLGTAWKATQSAPATTPRWPNLQHLCLSGYFDEDPFANRDPVDGLFSSVTAALHQMPKIRLLSINMDFYYFCPSDDMDTDLGEDFGWRTCKGSSFLTLQLPSTRRGSIQMYAFAPNQDVIDEWLEIARCRGNPPMEVHGPLNDEYLDILYWSG